MKYHIYTDGSCRNNGKENAVGAWGYSVLDENEKHELCYQVQAEQSTTNQRMELIAAIQGCKSVVNRYHLGPWDEAHIFTDSAYIHNCLTQKWYENWRSNGWINSKKQPVANRDLWEQLIPFFNNNQFYFHKVPGHMNNKWNNHVDEMVQRASAKELLNGSNS